MSEDVQPAAPEEGSAPPEGKADDEIKPVAVLENESAEERAIAAREVTVRTVRARGWRKWAFAIVPAVGVIELLAHAKQVSGVVPDSDWKAARAAVEPMVQPSDLVVFAPKWVDPIGREFFGEKLAGMDREARPDESRFPRAIEVSIRGKHRDELAGWRKVGEQKVGAITITTYENPSPATVIDDLLTHARPDGMIVTRVDNGREVDCAWMHSATAAGGLGAGPNVPGDRFACAGGGFVGAGMIHALDDSARRCFYAPPIGGPSVLRARFVNVAFGQALHGHVGMAQFAERDKTGVPVTLTWKIGDRVIGKISHQDGDGWKGFELSTAEMAGQRGELTAEITAANGNRRQFCFEADTR